MQIVKTLLGTNTTSSATDLATLRTRHSEAAGRVAAGAAELERLTATVDRLKLDRARLLDARDLDPGLDLFEPIRRAEGALASAQKRLDDLQDVMRVRTEQAGTLEAEVRAAERAEAPRRMKALAREHGELRNDLRTDVTVLKALADRIIATEAAMQQLHNLHGIKAEGVLVIEGLATSAQSAAADILSRLAWQDRQLELGNALADKLERDRDEVDRRNTEAGVPGMWRAPGADYFRSGWVDESTEERTARVSG
jgi:chromosome segregation ATPase